MKIIPILTKQYAVCVYVYGTRKFETVVSDYHEPIKQFAAKNYTLEQIDNALVKEYITESEYIETMKYTKAEESPAE